MRDRKSRSPLHAAVEPGRRLAACAAALILGASVGAQAAPQAASSRAEAPPIPTLEELSYPPQNEFEVPEPTRVELPNGLVLILVEDHELPLIDAFVRVRTGGRLEPAGKAGLATLTGAVLRTGGTTSRTGPEIDRFLENRAASVETGIGIDSGSASARALAEDFADVLEMLVDVLRNPAFDASEIAVAKNRINAGIARQNDNPTGIMSREFARVVRGADSAYTQAETFTSIASLTRSDLIAFHERYFHPGNMIVGVVGDFETPEMIDLMTSAFGDWPGRPPEPPFEGGYREEPTPGVFWVEKNDVAQSNILMGHPGVRKDNPDFYAIEVFNEMFSGGFTSRLLSRIRSDQGLAYTVSGRIGSDWDRDGVLQLFTSTKTETTGAAIESLLTEARKVLDEEPPTEEEVEQAKRNLLNSFVFASDSSGEILGRQLLYEYFGYPLDRLEQYVPGIEAVTTEQVAEVARKYIDPEAFTILVVGPAEGRDRPLSDFGEVTEIDITIPPLDEAAVAATTEAAGKGMEWLGRSVEAHGGEEVILAFESIRQRAEARATTAGGEIEVAIDQWVAFPGALRQLVTLPSGVMTTIANREGAWVETPEGKRRLEGRQWANVIGGLPRTLPVLLRLAAEGRVTASELEGGEEEPGARVAVTAAGEEFRLHLDADGRIVAIAFEGSDFQGRSGEVLQNYSDYRPVGGVLLPFRVEATFEGSPYLESEVESAEWNPEVGPDTFSMTADAASDSSAAESAASE